MKNTKIILGTLALSAFAASALLLNTATNVESSYSQQDISFETKDAKSWDLAAKYYNDLRKNVNTGQIEKADYDAAYQHYKNMNVEKTTSFTFVDEGPDNVGGRTRAIAIDPTNDNKIWAGAVTGGLFRSTNGANSWTRVQGWDDATELLSISSVAVTKNGTIYVATGGSAFEGDLTYENSGAQRGDGLWYSDDNGASFTQVSGTNNKDLTKVTADLSQSDVVYITGNSFGVKKMVNKGALISITAPSLSANGSMQDVKVSANGSVVIATASNKVWTSQDGGNTFMKAYGNGTPNLIQGSSSRIESSVSFEKNANGKWNCYVIKVLSNGHIGAVWLSEDNGVEWTKIGQQYVANVWDPLGSQGNYDVVISAVKGHPNQCVIGGLNLYKWTKSSGSSPTSGSWETLTNWAFPKGSVNYVHADIHRLTFDSQGKMFIGSDGGVQASMGTDLTQYYDANRGYNVTQFYGIGYGPDGAVIGGAQDNGTQYNNHSAYFSNLEHVEVNGGDGFECEISYLNPDAFIASLYNSGIRRFDGIGGGSQITIPASDPTLLGDPSGGVGTFYTPLRLYEDDNDLNTQDSIEFIPSESYSSGDVVNYASLSFELPLEYTLTQDLFVDYDTTFITTDTVTATFDTLYVGDTLLENGIARDTIMLPDYKQSLFATHTDLGIYITRDMMRYGSPMEWWQINPVGNQAHSFAFSKDGDNLWIGTYSGQVYRVAGLDSAYSFEQADYSYKDSASYELTVDMISIAGSGIITDISVDKNDPNKVVVVRGGTGNNHVYYSTNALSASPTWTNIGGSGSNSLPNVPVFGVEIIANASTNETIIVGTEFGAFVTENVNGSGTNWTPINNEIGLVPVFDVRQQWRSRDQGVTNPYVVYLGTHGRGIWKSEDVLSVEEPIAELEKEEIANVVVFPNPMSSEGKIGFELNSNSDVAISIYDLQGKIVNNMIRTNMAKGNHVIPFSVQDLPNGTYLITLKTENTSEVVKFIKY